MLILVFGKYFLLPAKWLIKLAINSVLGALLIYVINLVGISFNFHIGFSIVNSIIVGILGIPRSMPTNSYKNILWNITYSTVTDFARLRGLSTSNSLSFAI
jgi:pro-sigmaK processing inhibitor BofA